MDLIMSVDCPRIYRRSESDSSFIHPIKSNILTNRMVVSLLGKKIANDGLFLVPP
jgi:hypothetical protein